MIHSTLLFIGYSEWIFIVILVLIIFGGKKIPELMRGVGKGMKEFKKGLNEDEAVAEEAAKDISKGEAQEKAAKK